jgi:hypothetical protein
MDMFPGPGPAHTVPVPARRGRAGMLFLLLAATASSAGCSVGVPDPAAPQATASTPALSTPTVTPGHDAAAVAARDMSFAAGESLAAGVPVRLSDGLADAPGWKPGKQDVAGGSEFMKADGCLAAAKVRVNQQPLAVSGDDKASTVALFQYMDPSIQPAYLKADTLRWGGDPDKPGPRVEVLVLEPVQRAGAGAAAVYARLFGTAGSSVYISVSCPDAAALASARADVAGWLAVVPPD